MVYKPHRVSGWLRSLSRPPRALRRDALAAGYGLIPSGNRQRTLEFLGVTHFSRPRPFQVKFLGVYLLLPTVAVLIQMFLKLRNLGQFTLVLCVIASKTFSTLRVSTVRLSIARWRIRRGNGQFAISKENDRSIPIRQEKPRRGYPTQLSGVGVTRVQDEASHQIRFKARPFDTQTLTKS